MQGLLPFFLCLVVICLVSDLCHGATWLGIVESRDGKCLLTDGSLRAVGETWYKDEDCVRIDCSVDNGTYYVSGASCGLISVPDTCRLVPRPGHYPNCCPRPVCD